MATIDITAVGGAGTHTLRRTNVNTEGDFFYFSGRSGVASQQLPSWGQTGNFWIYRPGVGSVTGLTSGTLYTTSQLDANSVQLLDPTTQTAINFTGVTPGSFSLNYPFVFNNQLNIASLFSDRQAVRYLTNGDPIGGLTNGATYYTRNTSTGLSSPLYAFSSHSFTSAGVTGQSGPAINTLVASYTSQGASWAANTAFFRQGAFQGYQDWTVPVTGVYEFNVAGAPGRAGRVAGGGGAIVRGRVVLTRGEVITIAVGQRGQLPPNNDAWPASSGGTFVVRKTGNVPLFVAGGGSASSNFNGGRNAVLTINGDNASGTAGQNGNGAPGNQAGGGGGGFLTAGGNSSFGGGGGGFNNGLVGGSPAGSSSGAGGFGGGAGSDGQAYGAPGGAGGYSGGAAAPAFGTAPGGGGGSYAIPTATNLATSTGTYQGISTFNGAAITNLNQFNTGTNEGSVQVTLVNSSAAGTSIHPTAADANANTNAITLTPAGTEFHALVPITLDLTADTINTTAAHGISDGDALTYSFSGTAATPLSNSVVYYADRIDNWTFKLSTTPSPFNYVNFTVPSAPGAVPERFGKVVVNVGTNIITIPSHGFLPGQPVRYSAGSGGTAIAPLVNNATYYIRQVIDVNNFTLSQALNGPEIDLTLPGTGTAHSFIYIVVNLADNSLYIPNHQLVTGSRLIYSRGTGSAIGGLTNGATYFAVRVDDNSIKLSTTKDGNNVVDLTTLGTGNHALTTTPVDLTADSISIPSHGFSQGELVQYDSVGQTAIGGLTSGAPYYIVLVDGDNIKLATTLENANAGIAVNLTIVGVGSHRILSLAKSPDGTYEIKDIPSANTFTVQANGFVPEIEKVFNPRTTLNIQQNNLRVDSHGFVTGTKVAYTSGGGTALGGLATNTDYYVISINRDYIQLAASAEDATSGVPIEITDFGNGVTHTLTTAQINGNVTGAGSVTTTAGSTLVAGTGTAFAKILKVGDRFRLFPPNTVVTRTFAASAVNINPTNTITVSSHGFNTGDHLVFSSGTGGVAPTGLFDNYLYFVRAVDANTLRLFNTAADATANTNPVVITAQGSGTSMTFSRITPSAPIIRRITAIGSDNQITVDRPYTVAYTGVSYSYSTFIYVRPQGYNLHRSFDGGVEMSVGVGTSFAQIIRQTRKYFRYQSGKGIQTSFAINYKPTIDLEYLMKVGDFIVEGRTRRPHGLINGLSITISEAKTSTGEDSSIYNGTFQVTVLDSNRFTIISSTPVPTEPENMAYGFPQFYVNSWRGGAVRAGMFDFQNGLFWEFDGEKLYAVRRSSTQQIAGTASALQGSDVVFGTGTQFTRQLQVNDMIVMRGQSYKVSSVQSDTRITIKPEYKGSSGIEKEFNPGNGTTGVVRVADDIFFIQSHGFTNNLPVVYNSIDGTPIGGLINGRTYYVDLIDNNNFKLKASPDAVIDVSISNPGAGSPHSFTPAKSGIIITKTVDTRTPQEDWSIDPCDGNGPTGYNLDLSRIQMCYIDYSWYGAGKIRYGFKGVDGQVVYVHEYTHNNFLYESYFRSGNLPARYEVATGENPTYIPFLFHWGTSVIMDGRFDDDRAYLFSQNGQTLNIGGTTTKTFGSSAINIATDRINIPSHGFTTGDPVIFFGRTATGTLGENSRNPATQNTGTHPYNNLQNSLTYFARAVDVNNVTLHPTATDATNNTNVVNITSQGSTQFTYLLTPSGAVNNTSGANYQPLLSLRLSPSVSAGLTGKLGDRDILNRMQLRLKELSIQTNQLIDVKLLINGRLNNLNFAGVESPSLTQVIQHTSNDTISGGVQIYNIRAAGGAGGTEASTTVDINDLFELSNSILGGDSVFPDGPDILTVAVARLTGNATLAAAKLTWTEAQA